ncbi:hypothetical protein GAFPHCNK_03470 [[Clostridium] scindens]|uniref:hypothetical protein n=1 Tax=Clostridium scindens (strain JCM 10418 / VPI 12708) TaxID=29347 RepID=UPI0034C626ED
MTFTIGIDFSVVVRVELLVNVHPALGFLNVDTILFTLIVIVLHNESPPSAFAEMESFRHAKPDHR